MSQTKQATPLHAIPAKPYTQPLFEDIQEEVYRACGLRSAVLGLECLNEEQKDGVVYLIMAHEERLQALVDKART